MQSRYGEAAPFDAGLLGRTYEDSSASNNSGDGGRASGGPVWPGWSGTVGEQGPERLTIGKGGFGYVTPSTGGGSGGGDIHFHIDLRGATLTSGVPDQLIKQISAALPWRERYMRVRR